jgi:hypothetical protein
VRACARTAPLWQQLLPFPVALRLAQDAPSRILHLRIDAQAHLARWIGSLSSAHKPMHTHSSCDLEQVTRTLSRHLCADRRVMQEAPRDMAAAAAGGRAGDD